jgi:sirohydrochlorin ferrochelatase
VPLFVPALTAMLVLLVLFGFGVREQNQLARDSVEQLVSQREEIARIVAAGIEEDLRSTEASAARLARDLAEHLDDSVPDADAEFARLFETLADGSTRSRRQLFDPVTDAGVWIPNYVKLDAGLRTFLCRPSG